ncbi:MAG: PEP-CTERM sorting domain-containing protein, partial [Planctomycetota bacterium]
ANAYVDITGTAAIDAYFLGDIDGDIDVDRDDFRLFKSDFLAAGGDLAALAAVASVPEPATIVLLSISAVIGMARRRRR